MADIVSEVGPRCDPVRHGRRGPRLRQYLGHLRFGVAGVDNLMALPSDVQRDADGSLSVLGMPSSTPSARPTSRGLSGPDSQERRCRTTDVLDERAGLIAQEGLEIPSPRHALQQSASGLVGSRASPHAKKDRPRNLAVIAGGHEPGRERWLYLFDYVGERPLLRMTRRDWVARTGIR